VPLPTGSDKSDSSSFGHRSILRAGICVFTIGYAGHFGQLNAQEVRRAIPIEPFFKPDSTEAPPANSPTPTPGSTPIPTRRAIPIPTGKPVPFDVVEPPAPTPKLPKLPPKPEPTPTPAPKPTPLAVSKPTPVPTPKPVIVIRATPAPAPVSTPPPIAPPPVEPTAGTGSTPVEPDRAALRPDQVQFEYANSLYARKMYEEAAPEYERYLSIYPSGPDRQTALFRLAECHRAKGNVNAAKAAYDSLLTNYSTGEFIGSAAYRLAELYFAEKDYREALPYFRKASIRLKDPVVVNAAKFNAALCLENLNFFSEARINYEDLVAAREQNPYREDAWLALAKLLLDAGRKADAAKQLDQLAAEAQKPEVKAEALVRTGLLKIELGQPDKAAADLNKALKIPEIGKFQENAQVGLLHVLYDQGKYKQVVEAYKAGEAAFSKETRPEVALLAANAYRQLGQSNPAQELYGEIIKEFPDSGYSQDAQYEQLVALYNANSPEVVPKIEEFLKLEVSKPKRELATLLKAEALYKAKQYQLAIPVYVSLQDSELPPELKAEAFYKLGWCYSELADNENTAKAFGDFISKFPNSKNLPAALAQKGVALQKAKNYGVMGPFSFTEGRDPADASGVVVLEMQGGKFRIFGETS